MLSLVFSGMILTHLQLKALDLISLEILPTYAGRPQAFTAVLSNPNPQLRSGINLRSIQKGRSKFRASAQNFNLVGHQNSRVTWTEPSQTRGRYFINRLELSSHFPLGLFYTWKLLEIEKEFWVYPALLGKLPLPLAQVTEEGKDLILASSATQGDEFRGHRDYRFGDSARHIDWKAFARGRPMLIKEINEGGKIEIALDWRMLSKFELTDEERVSQLALWVTEAFSRSIPFQLLLPGQLPLQCRSESQLHLCLQSLACLGKTK